MTKKSRPDGQPVPVVEQIPSVQGGVSAIASANAPLIFFDVSPTSGYYNGVAHITLEAIRSMSGGGSTATDRVVVAHLRMNFEGLMALKVAVANAELLAQKAAREMQH
jgi:hypothetical protein